MDGCLAYAYKEARQLNALKRSIGAVPHELIEQTIQLHAQNPEAFENSVGALCAAVCDTFRPATATEFVEKLNEDIRSDIDLGRSKGRDYAREISDVQAAFAASVVTDA
jgi:hypothetical protein